MGTSDDADDLQIMMAMLNSDKSIRLAKVVACRWARPLRQAWVRTSCRSRGFWRCSMAWWIPRPIS